MDYKYIEQLMERYWQGGTSLEEEKILRAFFSQKDVPASMLPYKDIFVYEVVEKETEKLDSDFDTRIMSLIEKQTPVKARTISLTQRLMPLFKSAAVVAVFLTLGNAAHVAFEEPQNQAAIDITEYSVRPQGKSVALGDTVRTDTVNKARQQMVPILIK